MKHVTFIKPVFPLQVGERRLVPDETASGLERQGLIAPGAPDFPPAVVAAPAPPPKRRGYQTKA